MRVARGTRTRIRQFAPSVVLQIQEASDPDAALVAAARARAEILNLDGGHQAELRLGPDERNGPKDVSPVIPALSGPCISFDGGAIPTRVLTTVPEILVRHLEQAGVHDAVVTFPSVGPLVKAFSHAEVDEGVRRGVVLRLFSFPDEIPLDPRPGRARGGRRTSDGLKPLVSGASEWFEAAALHGPATVDMGAVEFEVPVREAASVLNQAIGAMSVVSLVSGSVASRFRGVQVCPYPPCVGLVSGGPTTTDAQQVLDFEELAEVGRGLGDSYDYACIEIPYGVDRHWACRSLHLPKLRQGYVSDAYPWQVLGPAHLARLDAAVPGAQPLGTTGKVEVAIGAADEWLIEAPPDYRPKPGEPNYVERIPPVRRNQEIVASARRVLAKCLVPELQSQQ